MEIFSVQHPSRRALLAPSRLLYNGYRRSFLGLNQKGRDVHNRRPFSTEAGAGYG